MSFSFETHCERCQEPLGDTASIGCDQCGKWVHRGCTDVTQQEFDMLGGFGENKLFCDECTENRCILKGLVKQIDEFITLTIDLRDRLAQAERGDNPALVNKIEEIVKKEVKEMLEEKEEQDKRSESLIIVNIAESDKQNEEEREKEDERTVIEILKRAELNQEELDEISVDARLGREVREGRKRPIKISTKNPKTKAKILRTAA